jgi:hypothetical protein
MGILSQVDSISSNILLSIQKSGSYEILDMVDDSFARVSYSLEAAQSRDDRGTIYEAEIYRLANFTALVATNESDSFVLSANIDFLSQVNLELKEIIAEAKVVSCSSGKRHIEVIAKANDIRVFLGEFIVLKLDDRSSL